MREALRILERVQETPSTVTLRFRHGPVARPGQFVMLWVPGDDEVPMSLSYTGEVQGVTVKVMGSTSERIQHLRAGDWVGVRGPYGNAFDPSPKRILVVAGGSGAAVLAPAAEAALDGGSRVDVALGATTGAELLFRERFARRGATVHLATDDGSVGTKGFVTDLLDEGFGRRGFDAVWTCGPEVMMRKVALAAEPWKVPVVFSVERVMKCALGLCDACALGPFHVCVDGPVFPAAPILALEDFGRFHRDASGRRVPFRGAAPPAAAAKGL